MGTSPPRADGRFQPSRRVFHDLLAVFILILGVSVFHSRGLRPGYTYLPVDLANNNLPWRSGPPRVLQNWLISDPLYQFFPFLSYTVDSIRSNGRWPMWNPTILAGQPVVADPLTQPFYPVFAVLGFVLGAARGMAIGLWLHAALAAGLTFGLLRTLGCRRHAAVLGAFTFALSGYLVTWFGATHRVITLTWLPGILWAFELALRRRKLVYIALTALALTLTILGGQYQFVATFGLFLTLYAIGRALEAARYKERHPAWPLVVLSGSVGLAALLSAIQTLPFLEFLSLSHRASAGGLTDSLPLQQLITLIAPDFYGNPSRGSYWGELNYAEGTMYAGLVALLLALLAPLWTRRLFATYLSIVTVAFVYVALGGPGVQSLASIPLARYISLHRITFLWPLLIALLAGMAVSEQETPIALVAAGCVVLAVALGLTIWVKLDLVRDHWDSLRWPVVQAGLLLGVTAGLLTLRVKIPGSGGLTNWLLVGVVFVDLYLSGSGFIPVGRISRLMPPAPVIDYLREHTGQHRVVAYQRSDVLFGPNVLSIFGLSEAGGYSSVLSARYRQLVRTGDPVIEIEWMAQDSNSNMVVFSRPSVRLLDLLQVAYVVSPEPLADPGVRAERSAESCTGTGIELSGGQIVKGTVRVRDMAINRIDLRFGVREQGPSTGLVTIRLWRGAEGGQQILDAQVPAVEIEDQEAVTFYFAPEREAPGQVYRWEVGAIAGSGDTGVRLCTDDRGQPAISLYGADWSQAFEGRVYVFKRLAPLPRAYVVYAAESIPDDNEAVDRLLNEAFDLRNVAVTSAPLQLPQTTDRPATRADIGLYKEAQVVVEANALQRGLLVLGDHFHPGWRAHVDGEPAPIHRVNHVFRGVVLEPGRHEVVFEFAPASLRTGRWLGLAGLLAALTLVILNLNPRVRVWQQPKQGRVAPKDWSIENGRE